VLERLGYISLGITVNGSRALNNGLTKVNNISLEWRDQAESIYVCIDWIQ